MCRYWVFTIELFEKSQPGYLIMLIFILKMVKLKADEYTVFSNEFKFTDILVEHLISKRL